MAVSQLKVLHDTGASPEGMMNYPLAAREASGELRRAWHLALIRIGISSLRLDGIQSRTKDLLGLPTNVPTMDQLNIVAKLMAVRSDGN
eukprot:6405951-Amphidinium_carterae.2